MNNKAPSLSPQGLNAVKASLMTLTSVCSQLASILDRSPEQVSHDTVKIANKFNQAEKTTDNFLQVDGVLRMIRLMETHVNSILNALENHNLYDDGYKAANHTGTLVAALQEKRDVVCKKRSENGFLNNTFGDTLNDIGKNIQTIYEKIPLHTQKAA